MEQLLIDSAPLFERHGIEVEFVNLFGSPNDRRFPDALRESGAGVTEIDGGGILALPAIAARLVGVLERTRPSVLHTHMFHATIAGWVAGAMARVPARVVTRHFLEAGYAARSGLSLAADARALRAADCVIAVSRAVASDVCARTRVAPTSLAVIPNGIDLSRFNGRDGAARMRRADRTALRVGSVGTLLPYKGHDTLLRAAALALQTGVNVNVAIAGEGPARGDLEELARQLRIGERVVFAGFQRDIPGFLESLDLYVHPALDEALGIAILEAMAARTPVIASDVGGIPDIISGPDVGILVPPGEPRALAAAILQLERSPERREALGLAGRSRVERFFTVQATVESYARVYRSVVSPGRRQFGRVEVADAS